ncbi:hypothetical protein BS78_10G274200 [Paspalum vaginatum]|nr:hypothetical protein BS78_10G274200 [Paspalum vaginatum]
MVEELLPDDILADVLSRLPPCGLAASGCVRKHWCSVIDTRRLLRAELLPLRLDAFLFNNRKPHPIAAGLEDFSEEIILDHCNGLLLLSGKVANLATRQRLLLPPFPPHPPVFRIPLLKDHGINVFVDELGCRSSEWPPSPYTVTVFSSRKWRWEERSFVPQREPSSDNVADMRHEYYCRRFKMALSNNKYQMIKAPGEREITDYRARYYLEKSEKGVWPQFRVWFPNEAGGQLDWELRSNINLEVVVESFPELPYAVDYGRLQEIPQQEEGLPEWDFEGGFIVDNNSVKERKDRWHGAVFLGFHPYKEIAIFYLRWKDRIVFYHLNSAKVSELGIFDEPGMTSSFQYTPCWELLEEN